MATISRAQGIRGSSIRGMNFIRVLERERYMDVFSWQLNGSYKGTLNS